MGSNHSPLSSELLGNREDFEPSSGIEDAAPEPQPQPLLHLEVSAQSDVGCVRANNEDAFGYSEADGLYVVCDGMGGMASGEVASALAVVTMVETFAASGSSGAVVSTRLLEAISAANRTVWLHGQSAEHKGMGTTVVAAATSGDKLIVGNVGDSRAYLMEGGQCVQMTVDHSYVNELIRNGTLTRESAHHVDLNGMESVITRALGAEEEVQPDFFAADLHPGSLLLLATDGLTRYLLQDEIAMVLANSPFDLICGNLIQLAKERGGHDNITCLALRVSAY
jgi:serine/threonine protein phosphatase PrpC